MASEPRFSNKGAWWCGLTQCRDNRFGAAIVRSLMILHSMMDNVTILIRFLGLDNWNGEFRQGRTRKVKKKQAQSKIGEKQFGERIEFLLFLNRSHRFGWLLYTEHSGNKLGLDVYTAIRPKPRTRRSK
jgi:hypothetical protein